MTTTIAQEVSHYLQGTCQDTADAARVLDISDEAALAAIIEIDEIERCVVCSWWCEHDELKLIDDEYVCEDCIE